MSIVLSDTAKRLLDSKTFAVVTTLDPDGSPQSTVIWVKRDGDDVVFSTAKGRRKARNLSRDPRATIAFYDPDNPYVYVGLEGRITLSEEDGRELIDELAHKYTDRPYPAEPPEIVRLVCRFTAHRQVGR